MMYIVDFVWQYTLNVSEDSRYDITVSFSFASFKIQNYVMILILMKLWTFYDFATKMILTVVILKVLNSLIHQSFSGENTKIKWPIFKNLR